MDTKFSLVTVDQVADRLQLTRKTIRKLVAQGEIPAVRIGRSIRIPGNYLELMQDAQTARP